MYQATLDGDGVEEFLVTVPRFRPGIPLTVGKITNKQYESNPVLAPYPDWSWHLNPTEGNDNKNKLIYVYSIATDKCNRLYIADTGRYLSNLISSPKIFVFDYETDLLIKRFSLPPNVYTDRTVLNQIAIDDRGDCNGLENVFAYISDRADFALIVADLGNDKAWKITHRLFYPYPTAAIYNVNGTKFELMDGLGSITTIGDDLYFKALSSYTQNKVPLSIIRDDTLFATRSNSAPDSFILLNSTRCSQTSGETLSSEGILLFTDATTDTLRCWNPQTVFHEKNFDSLITDHDQLQWAGGLKTKTDPETGEEYVYVMSNRLQRALTRTLTPNEVNYRLLKGSVDDLLKNSKCRI